MKTTIRALLINLKEEQREVIDNMMTVFQTAVRFAFDRLLEGFKTGELEKTISAEYSLNIMSI